MKEVEIGDIVVGNERPAIFISGPCQIESRDHAFRVADALKSACQRADTPFVFKASYDKANRTSLSGARGVRIDAGLQVLEEVRREFGCPVLTDVHSEADARAAGDVVDVLQIPAFLCRQTDLLLTAGETGKAVNVKKGQFMAPWDMGKVVEKIASTGNEKITLCERGASFGYNTLVTDFRALPIMRETGYPIVFDATHSVQEPSGKGASSGGKRQYATMLARAACVIGVAAVFAEAHDDPDNAPSDGPNMLPLEWVPQLLNEMRRCDEIAKGRNAAFGL
ncbi:MAG: 3-deoxy-8-phosphooctulonate synthase [Pseudomonadota bacterium]